MKTSTQTEKHTPAFTPGPWGLEDGGNVTYVGQLRMDGKKLFTITAQCDGGSNDGYLPGVHATKMCNARLIASAPELLESLETCKRWFERHSPTSELITGGHAEHPMLTMINQALAKALNA